jgi:hypothetical protein
MRAFFMTENRQFRHFIIFTMILIDTHDSAIRWEERSAGPTLVAL